MSPEFEKFLDEWNKANPIEWASPQAVRNISSMVSAGNLTDREAMYALYPKSAAAIYEGAHGVTNHPNMTPSYDESESKPLLSEG